MKDRLSNRLEIGARITLTELSELDTQGAGLTAHTHDLGALVLLFDGTEAVRRFLSPWK